MIVENFCLEMLCLLIRCTDFLFYLIVNSTYEVPRIFLGIHVYVRELHRYVTNSASGRLLVQNRKYKIKLQNIKL